MAEIINLGSLRFNGKPKTPGVKYNGEAIAFGDTIPGMAIPFVKWGKLLVACQCVCIDVSWMDMKNTGYIFGRPIKIDGTLYLCRSLKAIGADLRLYGPDADVVGQLVEYTEYDLVMVQNTEQRLPRKCRWARRNGDCIIIDRSAIVWMKEE